MSELAHNVRQLFQNEAPAARDYLALDDLAPAEVEAVRPLWAQAPLAHRLKIAQAVLELGEEDIEVDFRPFFRLALDDADARVRFMAIEGLWEDENPRLIPRLVALLQHDPAEGVRAAAAASLARFVFLGELGVLQEPAKSALQQTLLDVLHNPAETNEVRRRALEALAYADRAEVADLIAAAYQDPDPAMRQSAIFGMGRACDPAWTATVIAELGSPDPAMRFEAARACGEIEAEEALPALVRTLADPDLEVREMVIWALGEIGGAPARRALQHCLRDPNPSIQEAAQDALDELEFYESGALVPPLDLDMFPSDAGDN